MKVKHQSKLVISMSMILAACGGGAGTTTDFSTGINASSETSLLRKDKDKDREDEKDEDFQVFFKPTPVTEPGPLSSGRLLAAQCSQCHGTDGVSHNGIDSLAGESESELIDEMIDMKNDNDHDMMHLQARGYSNEQIRLIAAYFASIPAASGGND